MDRQTLRDWVIRFNERGPDGLIRHPFAGRAAQARRGAHTASVKKVVAVARTIGIDAGKNMLHMIGLDEKDVIVLRKKKSLGTYWFIGFGGSSVLRARGQFMKQKTLVHCARNKLNLRNEQIGKPYHGSVWFSEGVGCPQPPANFRKLSYEISGWGRAGVSQMFKCIVVDPMVHPNSRQAPLIAGQRPRERNVNSLSKPRAVLIGP